MSIRLSAAIVASKLVRLTARVLKRGGTAKPGEIALKICPNLLQQLSKDVTTIVVTGTNGKTTTCRMLEEAYRQDGVDCVFSRGGANMISGIATEFALSSSVSGKCKKHYAVIECDEAWTKHALPALKPKAFVVTNLFEDQLDRYGSVKALLDIMREAVASVPETTLCLNADDPVSSLLSDGMPNPVVYYGMDSSLAVSGSPSKDDRLATCVKCGTPLKYKYTTYAHLGDFCCPNCGHSRNKPDVLVTAVSREGPDSTDFLANVHGTLCSYTVALPARYNIMNAAATLAAALAADIPSETAHAALQSFSCGFGRMEQFEIGEVGARMILVKNAAGANQVLSYIAGQALPFRLVLIMNNNPSDGTDLSWLDDVHFESLCKLAQFRGAIVSGRCADTLRQRMIKAGVSEEHLITETDYEKLTDRISESDIPVFILPNYTAMMQYRTVLVKRCGGKDFWNH